MIKAHMPTTEAHKAIIRVGKGIAWAGTIAYASKVVRRCKAALRHPTDIYAALALE
jgi:hypothetical protein